MTHLKEIPADQESNYLFTEMENFKKTSSCERFAQEVPIIYDSDEVMYRISSGRHPQTKKKNWTRPFENMKWMDDNLSHSFANPWRTDTAPKSETRWTRECVKKCSDPWQQVTLYSKRPYLEEVTRLVLICSMSKSKSTSAVVCASSISPSSRIRSDLTTPHKQSANLVETLPSAQRDK